MAQDRAAHFRKQALEAETKAFNAKTEETRRAWLIVARDWTKMANKEETRSQAEEIEQLLLSAAQKVRRED